MGLWGASRASRAPPSMAGPMFRLAVAVQRRGPNGTRVETHASAAESGRGAIARRDAESSRDGGPPGGAMNAISFIRPLAWRHDPAPLTFSIALQRFQWAGYLPPAPAAIVRVAGVASPATCGRLAVGTFGIRKRATAMRNWLDTGSVRRVDSAGFLVLRLVMGLGFVLHGWPKIQDPFGWMGPEAAMPGILQALAAVAEFGGGFALIAGLLTRLASLGIACVMIVAIGMVHVPRGDPFVGRPGEPSYELAAVYLACAILFLLSGPGRVSLDALFFRKRAK